MHLKILIKLDEPTEVTDAPTDEQRAAAVRLLISAADRIARGDNYGGFHFSDEDTHEGGFVFSGKPPTR